MVGNRGQTIGAATLSNEFRLVAACCRWPRGAARTAAVRAAAAAPIDWNRVERVTRRHRVYAHVQDGLASAGVALPEGFGLQLARTAQQARLSALALARESALLQAAFDAADCPALSIKGVSLGMLAYGDPSFKWSWDIDLLTTPEAAARARAILERRGYALVEPAELDARKFERFLSLSKECVFVHPETQIAVELHWKLVDNPYLLPGIDALSPARAVRIGGRELRTLEEVTLLAYLLVHGTRHGWSRLKWLADVVALLSHYPVEAIESLYRQLQALGTGRAAAVGLLLCHDLFDVALPDSLRTGLRADRATRRLVAVAYAALTHGQGEREIPNHALPGIRILLSPFSVASGWRSFAFELGAIWIHPVEQLALPRPLWFLHYPLRPLIWAWRRSGALGRFVWKQIRQVARTS